MTPAVFSALLILQGTIHCSNLCTEIIEYTSPDEVAVCNLASIALSAFVDGDSFDFQKLYEVTKVVTKNLNKVIDRNYDPVETFRICFRFYMVLQFYIFIFSRYLFWSISVVLV